MLGEAFFTTAYAEPREWQDVGLLANADVWLTAEETGQVASALAAVLEPYRGRTGVDRPDASRRVRVMNMVSPHHDRSSRRQGQS